MSKYLSANVCNQKDGNITDKLMARLKPDGSRWRLQTHDQQTERVAELWAVTELAVAELAGGKSRVVM